MWWKTRENEKFFRGQIEEDGMLGGGTELIEMALDMGRVRSILQVYWRSSLIASEKVNE